MKRFLLGVGALLAGAACSAVPLSAGQVPQKWDDKVRQAVREVFFDPYSIRDASISRPFEANMVFDGSNIWPMSGVLVCMRANAKNKLGAYIGMKYTAFLFEGQTIKAVLVWPAARGQLDHHCQGREYYPFLVTE